MVRWARWGNGVVGAFNSEPLTIIKGTTIIMVSTNRYNYVNEILLNYYLVIVLTNKSLFM